MHKPETLVLSCRFPKAVEEEHPQEQFSRIKNILLEEEREKRRAKSQLGKSKEGALAEPDLVSRQLA